MNEVVDATVFPTPWDVALVRAPLPPDSLTVTANVPSPDENLQGGWVAILSNTVGNSTLFEAISVASPTLAERIRDASAADFSVSRKKLKKMAISAIRYDLRMRTRPTPFGIFSGVTFAQFGGPAETFLRDESLPPCTTRTRIDMDWATAMAERLHRRDDVLERTTLVRHCLARIRGERIELDTPRHTEASSNTRPSGRVSIRLNPLIARILKGAEHPTACSDLIVSILHSAPGVSRDVVTLAIKSLVEAGLLVSSLEPPLDGGDPLAHLLKYRPASGETDPEFDALERVAELIKHADATPEKDHSKTYRDIGSCVNAVIPAASPVHVESRITTEINLPTLVQDEASRAMHWLWRLAPDRTGMQSLSRYRHKFLERYGTSSLVPLLDVVDPAVGIGPPAGYTWPDHSAPTEPEQAEDRERIDRVIGRLLTESISNGWSEIVLNEATLQSMARPTPGQPFRSSELYLELVAQDTQAIDDGEFRLVVGPNPGTHEAGCTAARFLNTKYHSDRIARKTRKSHLAGISKQRPVEVGYAPRSARAANLAHGAPSVSRTSFGLPQAAGEDSLSPDDILIGATVDRMYAIHAPSGDELLPVTADTVSVMSQAPNAARLLWDIGFEGTILWNPWDWGPFTALPRVPRVRIGRVVVAPATWRIGPLRETLENGSSHRESVQLWRRQFSVPRIVRLLQTDHRIDLDLDDPWHVMVLVDDVLKGRADAIAEAGVDGMTSHWFTPAGGPPRSAEIVVSFAGPAAPPARVLGVRQSEDPIERARMQGWVYVKLLVPAPWQNDVLVDHLPRLVSECAVVSATQWHFLRYSDNDGPQLRIRFRPDDPADRDLVQEVIDKWSIALHDMGLSSGHSFHAYSPEIDRYGGPNSIDAAEKLFHADSVVALAGLIASRHRPPLETTTSTAVVLTAICAAVGEILPSASGDQWGGDHSAGWLDDIVGSTSDSVARAELHRWKRLLDPTDQWRVLADELSANEFRRTLSSLREAARAWASTRSGATDNGHEGSVRNDTIVSSFLHMTCNRLLGGTTADELHVHRVARLAAVARAARNKHRGGDDVTS